MGFTLKVTAGPGAGQSLDFEQAEVNFGRTSDNDVVIYDPNVSRRHFHIVARGQDFVVEDLGSSNGTTLNGSKVKSQVLQTGDQLSVGDAVFVFQAAVSEARGGAVARRARGPAPAAAAGAAPRARQRAPAAGLAMREQAPPRAVARGSRPSGEDALASLSARERFRRQQVAKTPIGRIKLWFFSLAPPMQKIVAIGGGLGTLLLLFIVLRSASGGVAGSLLGHDYSNDVIEITGKTYRNVYGYKVKGALSARYQATFKFRYLDGRATLYYDAGFIDSDQELELRLNDDVVVGYAPIALNSWEEGIEVSLPFSGLIQNEYNTITFDNVMNPGDGPPENWAITKVRVVEESLPEADIEQAQKQFDLAKEKWDQRLIAPENLYNSCRMFRLSRDYLERIEMKPPLYAAASSRAKDCKKTLNETWEKLKFTFIKSQYMNDPTKAKAVLNQALLYFPDESDPINRQIREKLSAFN